MSSSASSASESQTTKEMLTCARDPTRRDEARFQLGETKIVFDSFCSVPAAASPRVTGEIASTRNIRVKWHPSARSRRRGLFLGS